MLHQRFFFSEWIYIFVDAGVTLQYPQHKRKFGPQILKTFSWFRQFLLENIQFLFYTPKQKCKMHGILR